MLTELVERALTGPRHEDDADAYTRRILDAALAQFAAAGVRRSTMEDVARRGGLARATVYRRFPSKDELLEAVLLREVRRFGQGLDATRAGAATSDERVVEASAYCLEFLRGHALLRRLIETEPEWIVPRLTVDGDAVLSAARAFTSAMIRDDLYGASPVPEQAAVDIDVTADMVVRLTVSFLLNDRGAVPLDAPDDARAFSRRYLAPLFAGLIAAAPPRVPGPEAQAPT